jgi:hypothetical protein
MKMSNASIKHIVDLSTNNYSSGIVERFIELSGPLYSLSFFKAVLGENHFNESTCKKKTYYRDYSSYYGKNEEINSFSQNEENLNYNTLLANEKFFFVFKKALSFLTSNYHKKIVIDLTNSFLLNVNLNKNVIAKWEKMLFAFNQN